LAIDISETALKEANTLFKIPGLSFQKQNVEEIGARLDTFDVIVNFENMEHIRNPGALAAGASKLLPSGTFITSTPNGEISSFGPDGKLANEFHVKEFTATELRELLRPHFKTIEMYGQWLTPGGRLRKLRARQLFDDLNEAYFNPASKLGRLIKMALGKKVMSPPSYSGEADSFEGDYVIRPLAEASFPWEPTVILAVCSNQ
jgi:2-polyprenyl-3-methyl-5-hydroxy-6-metoxy-1,4-benzoquinol methylase